MKAKLNNLIAKHEKRRDDLLKKQKETTVALCEMQELRHLEGFIQDLYKLKDE